MKRTLLLLFPLFVACAATEVKTATGSSSTITQNSTMQTTIVIYTNPQSDLQVVNGKWQGSSLQVEEMTAALSNYAYVITMLGSRKASDAFNAERKQRIIYLHTAEHTEAIIEQLRAFPSLIETFAIKAPADDPDGP